MHKSHLTQCMDLQFYQLCISLIYHYLKTSRITKITHSYISECTIRISFKNTKLYTCVKVKFLINIVQKPIKSWLNNLTISHSFLLYQATLNGYLASCPVDFEIVLEIWTGGNQCYIIIPFSDEICIIFAIFRLVIAFQLPERMHMCLQLLIFYI